MDTTQTAYTASWSNKNDRAWMIVPFIALTVSALMIWFYGINQTLFIAINQWSHATGAGFWAHVTVLGDGLVAAVLFLPLLKKRPDRAWCLATAGIVCGLVIQIVKRSLDIPRPLGILPEDLVVIIGPKYYAHSFPSGHAATAFLVAGIISFTIHSSWVRMCMVSAALSVALSRVCAGIHWPLDICAGAGTGWLLAYVGVLAINGKIRKHRPFMYPVAALILLAASGILVFHYDTGYHQASLFVKGIGLLCMGKGIYDCGAWIKEYRSNRRKEKERSLLS